jgi:hypothetical protein
VGDLVHKLEEFLLERYSLEGLPNKVMAAEYKLALTDEAILVAELEKTQRALEHCGIAVEAGSKPKPKGRATKKQATTSTTKRKPKKKP